MRYHAYWISAAIVMILLLSSTIALSQMEQYNRSPIGFGSKVQPGDPDIGLPLEDFVLGTQAPATISYWDIGAVPFFPDEKDIFYLEFGIPGTTDVNEIRLTPYGIFPAGSKVTSQDNDVGQTLIPTGPSWQFKFVDGSGISGGYDLPDTVYLGLAGATNFNDIRITQVNGSLIPGSRVGSWDIDANWQTIPLNTWPHTNVPGPGSIAILRFYNANGNQFGPLYFPIYDEPDVVYLDVPYTSGPAIDQGVVSVGDIRLINVSW